MLWLVLSLLILNIYYAPRAALPQQAIATLVVTVICARCLRIKAHTGWCRGCFMQSE